MHTYPGLLFLHCKQEHCIDLIEYLSVMATIPPCPFDTCVRFYAILGGRAEKWVRSSTLGGVWALPESVREEFPCTWALNTMTWLSHRDMLFWCNIHRGNNNYALIFIKVPKVSWSLLLNCLSTSKKYSEHEDENFVTVCRHDEKYSVLPRDMDKFKRNIVTPLLGITFKWYKVGCLVWIRRRGNELHDRWLGAWVRGDRTHRMVIWADTGG